MRYLTVIFLFQSLFSKPSASFETRGATITGIKAAILNHNVSCKAIISQFLTRIGQYESAINSLVNLNRRLFHEAAKLDSYYADRKQLKGRLHCVPILVKDNIDVAGLPTTGGVLALAHQIPFQDADVVAKIKKEGGIIIGKANMSPMATWSARTESQTGGLCRNPYGLNYTTYGSSGGTAAGVAASFAVLGLGTETGMSLHLPASATGLVTFRPVQSSQSLEGVFPATKLLDVVGPMGRTVEDVALAADIMSGGISNISAFLTSLDNGSLRGVRVGIFGPLTYGKIAEWNYQLDTELLSLVSAAVRNMARLGAKIVKVGYRDFTPFLASLQRVTESSSEMARSCQNQWVNQYLQRFSSDNYQSLRKLLDSGGLPGYFQRFYAQAYKNRFRCHDTVSKFFRVQGWFKLYTMRWLLQDVDVLIMPTSDGFPPLLNKADETLSGCLFAAKSGFPSLNLPIGFSDSKSGAPEGLPFGLVMIARPENTRILFKTAYAYQKRFGMPRLSEMIKF